MEAQYFCHLSLTLAWIFLFSFPSVCSGQNGLEITLNSTVFVAFSGKDLSINVTLSKTTNQTSETLECYDPSNKQIYRTTINPLKGTEYIQLQLKNLRSSGLYSCKSNMANVNWFLHIVGYREPQKPDYTEIFIVAVFTSMLLVFSVLGSVYVFRGHWKETQSESLGTSRTQKQNREDSKETEKEVDNMDMTTAQSSSFYASLEPRPRSIYDVLDHSAASSIEKQTKSPEKELSKVVKQDAKHQDEGIFESVYENF
ncbi:NFAT activation molecule 1 [Anableps anableps]